MSDKSERLKTMELLAVILKDKAMAPELRDWLETPEGRQALDPFRGVLDALRTMDRSIQSEAPRSHIYFAGIRAPFGKVWVAGTSAGLVRVSFAQSENALFRDLRRRFHGPIDQSKERLLPALEQLEQYFEGKRRTFDLPVALVGTTPFQARVLHGAAEIPPGKVISYGALARKIGNAKASRAVGQALGRNPVPIVIPCHRIVRGGGDLGGYTGGLQIKKALLHIEGYL